MSKDTSSKETTSIKEKPVHHERDGALEVAVWRREGEKGPFYSVTMSRSYKQSDEWKHADSFGQDDLLPLSKLLDQAHSWTKANPPRKQAP